MKGKEKIAVLTGDIIRSTSTSYKGELIDTLKQIFTQIQTEIAPDSKFEIFRGDSFQGILKDPREAWKVALIIRAGLRGSNNNFHNQSPSTKEHNGKNKTKFYPIHTLWDARISIGIGDAGYTTDKIVESNGEAFILSGEGMDKISKAKESLDIRTPWDELNRTFNVVAYLIDGLVSKWTKNTAEVIKEKLLYNLKQEDIAEKLHITQSAVNQRFSSTDWLGISSSITHFNYVIDKKLKDE